jgi:hypothetical protein
VINNCTIYARDTCQKYKKQANGRGHARKPAFQPAMSSNSNQFSEEELETFSLFNTFICHGGYIPGTQVPTGYTEFAIHHQFDVEPLAMPSGAPIRSFWVDGRNTMVLIPHSRIPPALGRGNSGQNEQFTERLSFHSQKGEFGRKPNFSFEQAGANAKADLLKAKKFGELCRHKEHDQSLCIVVK